MTLELIRRSVMGLAVTGGLMLAVSMTGAIASEETLPDYRENVMEALDGHVEAAGMIVNGQVAFWHHLPDHAVAIVGASRSLLELFPDKAKEGDASQEAGTDKSARPPFPMLATQFNLQAARLVQLVPTGDKGAIKAQYDAMTELYAELLKATGDDSGEEEE